MLAILAPLPVTQAVGCTPATDVSVTESATAGSVQVAEPDPTPPYDETVSPYHDEPISIVGGSTSAVPK